MIFATTRFENGDLVVFTGIFLSLLSIALGRSYQGTTRVPRLGRRYERPSLDEWKARMRDVVRLMFALGAMLVLFGLFVLLTN